MLQNFVPLQWDYSCELVKALWSMVNSKQKKGRA